MAEPHSESVSSKQTSGGDESHQQQLDNDAASTSRPTGAGVDTGAGTTRPKTEAEKEADRLYEERMEEEYAKREGGA